MQHVGNEQRVQLRRKVRNADTELLEWVRCTCVLAATGELLVYGSTADGEDEGDAAMNEQLRRIDVVREMLSIEQKKKNKTRCVLVLADPANGHACVEEELMAPSARLCHEFVLAVLAAQQSARRKHSMLAGAVRAVETTNSDASPVPSPRSHDRARSGAPVGGQPPQPTGSLTGMIAVAQRQSPVKRQINRSESLECSNNSGVEVARTQPTTIQQPAPAQVNVLSSNSSAAAGPSTTVVTPSSTQWAGIASKPRFDWQLDGDDSSEASSVLASSFISAAGRPSSVHSPVAPLPSHVFAQKLASVTRAAHASNPSDFTDDRDSSVAVTSRRILDEARKTMANAVHTNNTAMQRSQIKRAAASSTAAAARATAAINRLRARENEDSLDVDLPGRRAGERWRPSAYSATGAGGGSQTPQQELHILMRVESALRQLEREKAQARERELQLTHEVQALQDALRVKDAERKFMEEQFAQLAMEKEEWKQAADRAQQALGQMEDELLIAREESQLLSSEQSRLKHQNKELLTHVHRLDSLVYGRF